VTSPYRRIEKDIAAFDAGTVWGRWVYGRRLLRDPSATTPAGTLRPGKMAELIDAAARAGVKLTEAEIEGRLAAGLRYPRESQIRRARATYGTWEALTEAGFPEFEADPGEQDYDPRTTVERVQQAERQLALGEPDQLTLFSLFPADQFTAFSTLADLAKYAADNEDITRRFADRNHKRAKYLAALLSAVGGDENATWSAAQAALDGAA
jgi:hypothetical protein